MFGCHKILRKKNVKENDFFFFFLSYEKYQRKSNIIKKIKNLCIFKLFNLYIDELK